MMMPTHIGAVGGFVENGRGDILWSRHGTADGFFPAAKWRMVRT